MANFDIERKIELNNKLREQNYCFCKLQDDFRKTFNDNSILLESELIDLSREISKTLRKIRICNIEIRRDYYIKEIIRNNSNIVNNAELENILSKIPTDLKVRGRSEKECKSKEYEQDILYFLRKENIINPRSINMKRILELKNKYDEALRKKGYVTLKYINDKNVETVTELDRREPIIFKEDRDFIFVSIVGNSYTVECDKIIDIY